MSTLKLRYDPLVVATSEIRLITLPPGITKDSEQVQFCLWHTPLHVPVEVQGTRLSLEEINDTLPPGWTAFKTHRYDYKYLFRQDKTGNTSWTYPDPACDEKHWAPELESPPADYKPEYEALSYNWGSPEDPGTALVEHDGIARSPQAELKTLSIGQNLATALRRLHSPDVSPTLWIDAICINQEDLSEMLRLVGR
ncbi:hypothetical protein E8E13_001129 [Curvularia kusanoi]|uniref:WW domain-containing protein n=1 Tax=Curvularia kusanoi TaxID=90978 RepID=A0A9P4T787_CURKU|nr:hypothetical protein E8E13_001129 [Curvularia kusanoi]